MALYDGQDSLSYVHETNKLNKTTKVIDEGRRCGGLVDLIGEHTVSVCPFENKGGSQPFVMSCCDFPCDLICITMTIEY